MNLKEQPKAVWAVAFACVIAFMGIGLVDPILPVLAQDLDATPSQVSLLFTSYFAITHAKATAHTALGWSFRFIRQVPLPSTCPARAGRWRVPRVRVQ